MAGVMTMGSLYSNRSGSNGRISLDATPRFIEKGRNTAV
jgi:hypothetical protein